MMSFRIKILTEFKRFVKLVAKQDSKNLQKMMEKIFGEFESLPIQMEGQYTSNEIERIILSGSPTMIARFGTSEFNVLLNYKYIRETTISKKISNFVRFNKIWWWDETNCQSLCNNAGFFPYSPKNMERFSKNMISSMKNVDVLGSWVPGENLFKEEFQNAKICPLKDFEPYYHQHPWSMALKGKNVLVVHPFAESIQKQYSENRTKLFKNAEVLPEFNLITFKAVQSIAGNMTGFASWFEALDWMTDEISRINFDVAIIGCGAYGFPLASRIKDMGKQAIHLGGATQILFGIKGKRWDSHPVISNFYNSYWIRPAAEEMPENVNRVEGACYW